MAKQTTLLPEEKIFEANAIARAQWSTPNVWVQRIAAVLINQINPTDKKFKPAFIRLNEIVGSKGGKSYALVRDIVSDLLGQRVIILSENGKDISGYNIFGGSVHYSRLTHTIKVGLNQELAPFYLELKKNFVTYGLTEFLSLPGTYHQALYKYLKSWESEPSKTVDIGTLHKILDCSKSLKKNYGALDRRALRPAHKFINEQTSLKYDYEPQKVGRKVVAVEFTIKSKTKFRKAPPISRSSKNEQ